MWNNYHWQKHNKIKVIWTLGESSRNPCEGVSAKGTTLMVALIIQGEQACWRYRLYTLSLYYFSEFQPLKYMTMNIKLWMDDLFCCFCVKGTAVLTEFCFMKNFICSSLKIMLSLLGRADSMTLDFLNLFENFSFRNNWKWIQMYVYMMLFVYVSWHSLEYSVLLRMSCAIY